MSDEMTELRRSVLPLVAKFADVAFAYVREKGSTQEAVAEVLVAIGMAHGAIIAAAAGHEQASALRGCALAVRHLPENVLMAMETINVGEAIREQETEH